MSGFVADSQGHTTSGPTITWREYEGLLARIRELEAQAVKDAVVIEAAKVLINCGVPEREDDPEYNSECYYCRGEWVEEEDGVMRIQHNGGCPWGALCDALNALEDAEGIEEG